jgi:serine/threonine protein kinase
MVSTYGAINTESSFPKRIPFMLQEISVLSQCRCPYITDYYGSYLHQTKLWIVMEYMAGGSVADLVCFVYSVS